MKAKDYNQLSTEDKVVLVMREGSRLDIWQKAESEMRVIFAMYNFFVEMVYALPANSMKQIRALENIADWEGYMGRLDLTQLE